MCFCTFSPGSVGPPPASLLRGTGAASLGVLGTAVEAIRQNTGVMEREKGERGLLLRAGYGETSGRFRQNREDRGKECTSKGLSSHLWDRHCLKYCYCYFHFTKKKAETQPRLNNGHQVTSVVNGRVETQAV